MPNPSFPNENWLVFSTTNWEIPKDLGWNMRRRRRVTSAGYGTIGCDQTGHSDWPHVTTSGWWSQAAPKLPRYKLKSYLTKSKPFHRSGLGLPLQLFGWLLQADQELSPMEASTCCGMTVSGLRLCREQRAWSLPLTLFQTALFWATSRAFSVSACVITAIESTLQGVKRIHACIYLKHLLSVFLPCRTQVGT